MRVRPAGIDDLQSIVGFIAEEAREAEGREQGTDTLQRGIGAALEDASIAQYWLLVDDSDKACGCTSVVKEWSDWNAGYYWWIQSMYIAPEHRGQGYLDTLLDAVREAGKQQGCLDLRLYVHKNNDAAIRAYEKAGFADTPYQIMSSQV